MSNERLGLVDAITSKRALMMGRLSPAARAVAFPKIYARPLPADDKLTTLALERDGWKQRALEAETKLAQQRALVASLRVSVAEGVAAVVMGEGGAPNAPPSFDAICESFCTALRAVGREHKTGEFHPYHFQAQGRSHDLSHPRQVLVWLIRGLTGASTPRIAKYLKQDHTTQLHSIRRAPSIMAHDNQLAAAARAVLAAFADKTTGEPERGAS